MTQNVEPQTPAHRIDGSYDIVDGNKIKISTASGQQSVLFEDIASLDCDRMTLEVEDPHWIANYLLVIGFIVGMGVWAFWNFTYGMVTAVVIFIIAVIPMMQTKQIYWDRITLETEGGKILAFDVDDGVGKGMTDEIETAKRKGLSG